MENTYQNAVETRDLTLSYGDNTVLKGVNVDIKRGEITVILGGSGCGKSTLLRSIIRLTDPSSGTIHLLGEEISAEEAFRIGLVNKICKVSSLNRILSKTANMIVSKDHLALKYTKCFINENQDLSIESVLARESIAMIMTGKSENLRQRLEKFVKKER